MVVTSRFGLRATRALRMWAARWSGRASASAPFTLPMGVRQASTTKTGLTLTYLFRYLNRRLLPTIRHAPSAQDSLGRRGACDACRVACGVSCAACYTPDGSCSLFRRPPRDCVPVLWPALGLVVVVVVVAAPFAVGGVRLKETAVATPFPFRVTLTGLFRP